MGKVTSDLSISADGFSAGLNQTEQRPFGDDGGDGWGDRLHGWIFATPTVQDGDYSNVQAVAGGATEVEPPGAFIMGRNMFGPVRGEWDRPWSGWWGDNPPYHAPVFVLTHYAREPQEMEGGTTFYFVTEGIESAFNQAREAAGERGISIHGGATTINQYLAAGLVDELRLHIVPILIGAGTRIFDGVQALTMEQVETKPASDVTHVTYRILH